MKSTHDPDRRRVVVTGRGAITPIGLDPAEFWQSLLDGRSGVGLITHFDAADLPTRIAAEVSGFDPDRFLPRAVSRRLDHFARYALAAADQAVLESKVDLDPALAERTAVVVGSSYGSNHQNYAALRGYERRGARGVPPSFAVTGTPSIAGGEIAIRYGVVGPTLTLDTACASGTTTVGEAMRLIRAGVVDAAIAGGADNPIASVDFSALTRVGALSRRNDEPTRASRPFDRDRDGFVPGAGSGMVVLEEAEHARRRGARILAELIGYGATTDAHHITAPHPDGTQAGRAIRLALADAGITPAEVDYVNAHGTSTRLNDRIETTVFRRIFADRAPKIPISSIKSMTGHMIAGSGTVELIATIGALRTGIVPPTINCDHPEDPELDYVPHEPRSGDFRTAVSQSFGFNGHNAVLVVRRWEE
jgi:3-oxoacyl-[acyl-carrier-protein] synthase II